MGSFVSVQKYDAKKTSVLRNVFPCPFFRSCECVVQWQVSMIVVLWLALIIWSLQSLHTTVECFEDCLWMKVNLDGHAVEMLDTPPKEAALFNCVRGQCGIGRQTMCLGLFAFKLVSISSIFNFTALYGKEF